MAVLLQFRDYGALKRAMRHALHRKDLNEHIPTWIWMAECEAQQALNLPLIDTEDSDAFTPGQDYIDFPADLVEPRSIRVEGDRQRSLELVSPDKFIEIADSYSDSYPRAYMIRGMTIALAPTPGSESYTLFYKAGIAHLGTTGPTPDEETNWLLAQWPNYLYYGALRHSAPWLGQDARLATWDSFFQPTVRTMRASAFRMKTGGGPVRMRPDTFA